MKILRGSRHDRDRNALVLPHLPPTRRHGVLPRLVWTAFNLAACATYLFLAIGRIYGGGTLARGLQAAGLTLAVGAIVLGYRFVVFLITLYTVTPP